MQMKLRLEIFDQCGLWKSEISDKWFQKVYAKPYRSYEKGEMKTYRLEEIDEKEALGALPDDLHEELHVAY